MMKRTTACCALAALALVVASAAQAEATAPVTTAGQPPQGLRLVSASATLAADSTEVAVRVTRMAMTRVLAPAQLRFALQAADGRRRAEVERTIGPAQLPRRNMRDAYLEVRLPAVPAAGEQVVVEWARASG